jgi:hypothetical protein
VYETLFYLFANRFKSGWSANVWMSFEPTEISGDVAGTLRRHDIGDCTAKQSELQPYFNSGDFDKL